MRDAIARFLPEFAHEAKSNRLRAQKVAGAFEVFGSIYADRGFLDLAHADTEAVFKGAELFQLFGLFEWSRGQGGIRREERATIRIQPVCSSGVGGSAA